MRKFLTLLAPAALLSGCGSYNGSLDSMHQPVVQRANYTLDLAAAGSSLAPGEGQRLAGWLASLRVGYGDRIALDDPAGAPALRAEVASQAQRFGLLLSDVNPVTAAGALPGGTVRVVITRTSASVPGCPDYSRTYTPDYSQSTTSNYGCAINSNLAAMVANPEDLVRGQPGTGVTDPATAAKAVAALRAANVTAGTGGTGGGSSSSSSGGGSTGASSTGGSNP